VCGRGRVCVFVVGFEGGLLGVFHYGLHLACVCVCVCVCVCLRERGFQCVLSLPSRTCVCVSVWCKCLCG